MKTMKENGQNYYLDIGNARDELLKSPQERAIFRFLEILPGFLCWITLIGVILGSWLFPVFIAFFIIAFDIYWLLKTVFFSLHLKSTYKRMRQSLKTNWFEKLKNLPPTTPFFCTKQKEGGGGGWQKIYHLIILPMYKESFKVVKETFEALINSDYPKEKFIVVLATEERAEKKTQKLAERIKKEYEKKFFSFLITCHPKDFPGELAGKGSNETWAAKKAKELIIDPLNPHTKRGQGTEGAKIGKAGPRYGVGVKIPYENIIVSVFDIDTRVYPQYFACLTYHFLTAKKPYRSSFQPIPIFNNNIWQAPALSRVVATSCTFWQMIQQERPERLATFSSQAMSFKALVEMNFWNVKNVSEDSRIFWRALLFYNGDYRVVPLFYPVSMDANLAPTFLKTAVNIYKQQRRWGWGSENIPYFIFGALKNKKMPFWKKFRYSFYQLEGFWSWATNSLIIFMLGWLPLLLGGAKFNVMVLSYNLPRITRTIMTIAMFGLVTSAIYSTTLLPPRPPGHPWRKYLYMIFQWLLLPLTIIIFGALPGLEAQTRLMLGKYMGFWVTPKASPKSKKRGREKRIFSRAPLENL